MLSGRPIRQVCPNLPCWSQVLRLLGKARLRPTTRRCRMLQELARLRLIPSCSAVRAIFRASEPDGSNEALLQSTRGAWTDAPGRRASGQDLSGCTSLQFPVDKTPEFGYMGWKRPKCDQSRAGEEADSAEFALLGASFPRTRVASTSSSLRAVVWRFFWRPIPTAFDLARFTSRQKAARAATSVM